VDKSTMTPTTSFSFSKGGSTSNCGQLRAIAGADCLSRNGRDVHRAQGVEGRPAAHEEVHLLLIEQWHAEYFRDDRGTAEVGLAGLG